MNSSNIQDKIAFYKEKIAVCLRVKSMIAPGDPYADYKLKNMDDRIKCYQEEIARLKPDNLSSWT